MSSRELSLFSKIISSAVRVVEPLIYAGMRVPWAGGTALLQHLWAWGEMI